MQYGKSRKSEGISEEVWIQRTFELFGKSQTHPDDDTDFKKLYHQDFSYEEALTKNRAGGHIQAYMELHIKHEFGWDSYRFNDREEAKEFFKKFPEVSKELERPIRSKRKVNRTTIR